MEEERDRISRDLHDSIATDLTALIWKARELARVSSTAEVATELGNFERRLSRTLGDLRDVVTALRASHSSFPEAVQALEERCRELAGGRSFSFAQEGELAQAEVERFCDEVFPIACELMKNAAEHSGGRLMTLSLAVGEGALSLTVSDDGGGLPPDRLEGSRGGLHNVQARLRSLGGELSVESAAKGATLTVTVPRPLRARPPREAGETDALPPSGIKRSEASPSHEHGSTLPRPASDKAR